MSDERHEPVGPPEISPFGWWIECSCGWGSGGCATAQSAISARDSHIRLATKPLPK